MPTTTYTYQASRFQWTNWELPEDAETIALAAVRDAGGEFDHDSEFVDGEWKSQRTYHLSGTQYDTACVERISLDEYAVTFDTDPERQATHDGFDRQELIQAWVTYADRDP